MEIFFLTSYVVLKQNRNFKSKTSSMKLPETDPHEYSQLKIKLTESSLNYIIVLKTLLYNRKTTSKFLRLVNLKKQLRN